MSFFSISAQKENLIVRSDRAAILDFVPREGDILIKQDWTQRGFANTYLDPHTAPSTNALSPWAAERPLTTT